MLISKMDYIVYEFLDNAKFYYQEYNKKETLANLSMARAYYCIAISMQTAQKKIQNNEILTLEQFNNMVSAVNHIHKTIEDDIRSR